MSDIQTVEQMTATLPDLSDADLTALRALEAEGEKRVTALEAIDAEIKRRADAAEKAKADQEEADRKAQAEGFTDQAGKVDAEAVAAAVKAKKPARAKSASATAKPTAEDVASANERGLAEARERIAAGQGDGLMIGFGDEGRAFKDIPLVAGDVRAVGPRLVTGVDILLRTGKLTGTVHVTHAWLIAGDSPLMRAELGAPMVVVPGQQIKIAAGRLAFA